MTDQKIYMSLAEILARESNCLRRKVGAVIVLHRKVVGAGNNFSPNKCHQCKDIGCIRIQQRIKSGEQQQLCRAVHAEQNALINALNEGETVRGATIYVTHQPCVICAKLLINAGITTIIYKEKYPDELAIILLKESGVKLIHYEEGE